MVLQQDIKVPIWGMADPGETVTVSLAGQTKITKGAADGKWRVNLDPLQTAEGLVLTVQGSKKIEVKDVLVGEVWLGAGQSNMVGRINDYKGRDEGSKKALAAGPFPGLRLFNQETGRWTEATPTTVGNFSALLFHFGAGLLSELKRPVGLMVGAVSGTPSGYWFTEDMYLADESAQAAVKEFAKTYDLNLALEKYDIQLADWKKKAEAARAAGQNPGIEPDRPLPPGGSKAELGHLYKKHILPMVPYGIRGVLWDQGEGGTGITGLDQYHAMGASSKAGVIRGVVISRSSTCKSQWWRHSVGFGRCHHKECQPVCRFASSGAASRVGRTEGDVPEDSDLSEHGHGQQH